jgi:hypothetical protein
VPILDGLYLTIQFEEDIWRMYGLTREIVPDELLKECQRRLWEAEPGSMDQTERQQELDALDSIRSYWKKRSIAFSRTYPEGMWHNVQHAPPCVQFLSMGRYWCHGGQSSLAMMIILIPRSVVASMMPASFKITSSITSVSPQIIFVFC